MRPISSSPARLARGLQYTIAATGSLAATWAAVPVAAAGQALNTPASDPFNAWSVGVAGGYHLFATPTHLLSEETYSSQGAGGFVSASAGRDVRMDRFVYGVHGDVRLGNTVAGFDSGDSYSDTISWRTGASLTGRAGYIADQDTLFYGLFGWSWQNYAASMSSGGPPTSTAGWVNGPTVGFGVEHVIAARPNMTFTGEVLSAVVPSPN